MNSYDRLFEKSGVLAGCCPVLPGLESRLTGAEAEALRNAVPAVRDRAAAARIVARALLEQAGHPAWSMPHRRGAPPNWPCGWIGSLSHSDHFGVAAVAPKTTVAGIGIDIEPAEPLPEELWKKVMVHGDVAPDNAGHLAGRILFSAKEAVYKAVFPIDGRDLDFHQVTVNLQSGEAYTHYGRRLNLHMHVDHRIVVLARLPGTGGTL